MSTESIVTGEAVALDLRLARAGSRMIAFAIDAMLVSAMLVLGLVVVGQVVLTRGVSNGDVALVSAVLLVTVLTVMLGYPVALETLTRGRSLGKLALGLRVVRDDGGPIRFRQAFVRGLLGFFELYSFAGAPALIVSLASGQGKRIGDYLAGTVVVQERVPGREAPIPPMPPQLVRWAASADLSGVSDALALSVRQFLARSSQLHPAARWDMEVRLATAVVAGASPPPPPGAPPWAVLAAVLGERRRREELRLLSAAPVVTADAGMDAAALPVRHTATGTPEPPPNAGPGGFAPPS